RPGTPRPDLSLTDRANLALERAGRLSLRERCDHVEVRHVLLSVLNVEGTAGQVLRGLAVDPDCVRRRLDLAPPERPEAGHPGPEADQPHPVAPPAHPAAPPAHLVAPRCPRCASSLDSSLAHRRLTSRAADGAVAQFVIAYCSMCGTAIAGAP